MKRLQDTAGQLGKKKYIEDSFDFFKIHELLTPEENKIRL